MKQLYLIFIIITGGCQYILPQDQTYTKSKLHIFIKTSYIIPSKKSFRNNYNQYFFIGNLKLPLSIGGGVEYSLKKKKFIIAGIGRKVFKLESNEKISLSIMPLFIGAKYYFYSNSSYLIAGLDYSWASFKIKDFPETGYGGYVINEPGKTKSYFGFGTFFGAGINFNLISRITNVFELGFNYNKLGSEEEGGLGNTGGINFTLYFLF